ncbi:putative RNA-binding protein 19 [Araneus ventricosus]|uniref:Putative RNA-binding protein 19 n=1 Tax=Araneus ventricosus TaxID=182803 RepID=A0A4Y2BSA6_ARAVE|nr:putative RNA-binding protein 19 [Araneus ventricosus]
MSRLIVKNLPKTITSKRLEKHFAEKGNITDVQLKYTKEGVFRHFAFIGYKTEEEAVAAKEYFNNTYLDAYKIQVEKCANLSDPNKPKSWKSKIAESKAHQVISSSAEVKEDHKENEKKAKKKKKSGDISEDIPEELLKDPQFKEFLDVNKDRKSKPVWAEDIDVEPETGYGSDDAGSSSDSDYDFNYKMQEETDEATDSKQSQTAQKKKKNKKSKNKDDADSAHESDNKSHIKKENKDDTDSEDKPDATSPLKKNDAFDCSFTVKLRNLPFKCKKKQIKQFFKPLKIKSLRLPPKSKGFAYVQFKTEREMKKALNKSKGFLDGHRVDVVKYVKQIVEESKQKGNGQVENNREQNEELLAETGRIYVRNLCYTVTEKEVEELFSKYGPLTEVYVPIDFLTKKAQGYAFVSYVFAEHAVKAFTELDGTIFQGRLLHLIPAQPKKEFEINENETNYKKKKEAKMKQMSGSSHNWNILFLGKNAVADVIAAKYNVEKSKLLSGDSKESVAVRMALAETEMVMESRNFLTKNGVQLDAFSQPAAERSKTVIVVKHLPAKTTSEELNELFSKFGTLSRVILPPSGLIALVEFENPQEAKNAFKRLAYSRFHNVPLYLEWAPVDGIKEPPPATASDSEESPAKSSQDDESKDKENTTVPSETSNVDAEEPDPGTTIFVRNLNFCTTQEAIEKHFKKCGPIHYAAISTKTDAKTGKLLSMGFGFVQFKSRESAVFALQNLQSSKLDGHALELKFANRDLNFSLDSDTDIIGVTTDGASVMIKVGKLMSCYHQLCFAHGLQLAMVDILYKKNIEKEEEHQEITSNESDTDDEDMNDTHEEQGVTVTATTDPRHLHLTRAEVIPRYYDLLQKVRKVMKLFKRSPTKYDMYLQKYVKEDTGKELSLILDCCTCWNSLLAMIERFHKLKVCIDKALIDIGSETKFSNLEWSKIKDLIDSLQPFKLAVEALCRRDSTLLTAETTLKFILEKLLTQDTVLSAQLSEVLRVRIKERRTVLTGILIYLQNPKKYDDDTRRADDTFSMPKKRPQAANQKKKYEVKKQKSAKILVRNIPFQASEKEVRELFEQLGTLKSVRLPKKPDGSGEHRGFGFVEYITKDNAERAFNTLCHSTHFFGRRLVLEWANPASEDVEELRKRTAKTYVHTLSSLCRRNSKVIPVDQHTTTQYRSASNSLLACTADRTPKRDFKDVRTSWRSQSINIHSLSDPSALLI